MQERQATRSKERLGLDIVLPGALTHEVSSIWHVAGWDMQFVRLQPGEGVPLDQSKGIVYVKVITGALSSPALAPFAKPKSVRTTLVEGTEAIAGPQGAIFAVFTATDTVPDNIHTMDQLAIEGPHADILVWQSFYKRFRGAEIFKGVDAHMVPGFHILDGDGTEIVYLHFWTMGKGADSSTHDHSRAPSRRAPAFAEIHWVFNNGTGQGAMYECAAPEAQRSLTGMQRGDEHGPFWTIDGATGMPSLADSGAVEYGWHGWQAGLDDGAAQAYDFVAAFEINPDYAPFPVG